MDDKYMDDKYYAVLDEDMRVKIFILQSILENRHVDATASEIIDLALDHMKSTIDSPGWDNVSA